MNVAAGTIFMCRAKVMAARIGVVTALAIWRSNVPAGTFRAQPSPSGSHGDRFDAQGQTCVLRSVRLWRRMFLEEHFSHSRQRLELIWQSALLWSLCLSDVDFEMFLREHSPTLPASANAREIIDSPFYGTTCPASGSSLLSCI